MQTNINHLGKVHAFAGDQVTPTAHTQEELIVALLQRLPLKLPIMKKFLAVIDGFQFSSSTMDYAIQLTKAANAHLVGVFLDDFIYRSYSAYQVMIKNNNYRDLIKEFDEKDKKKRDEAVVHFEGVCESASITFSIHRDKNIALQDLKHESIFADLIIINEYETFSKCKEPPPTPFIKELLNDVQCPVL